MEIAAKPIDSDLDASEESGDAMNGILEHIIPSKEQKKVKSRVIPVDTREKNIESLLFGSSSFLDTEQDNSSDMSAEDLSMDQDLSDSDDMEGSEPHILGLKAAKAEKVRFALFALHSPVAPVLTL
jgi:hypothetical protein